MKALTRTRPLSPFFATMPFVEQTNTLIIGAGPIGLELAIALKHAGTDYLHVEAGQIGQTISWYPKQARFFSSPERIGIAGVPLVTPDQSKATREQYLAYLRAVVQQFNLNVRTYERVVELKRDDDGFAVRTMRARTADSHSIPTQAGTPNSSIHARHVVLAVGDMHRPRRLNIPGEDLPHVSHYFDEPHRYFGQRLLIVGGRNSAVEAALRCHHAGARVSVSYRREAFDETSIKYWLLPEIKSLIKHERIGFYPTTLATRITEESVTLAMQAEPEPRGTSDEGPDAAADSLNPDLRSKTRSAPASVREIPADFVLLLTGYEMNPWLFEAAGVELEGENRSPEVNPDTMETNVPGLYVAGTAAAGTQLRFRLFIENCHPHVSKIVRAITGSPPPPERVNQAARTFGLPES